MTEGFFHQMPSSFKAEFSGLTLIGETREAEQMKMLIGGLPIALMADGAAEAHYSAFYKSPEQAQMPSPFR